MVKLKSNSSILRPHLMCLFKILKEQKQTLQVPNSSTNSKTLRQLLPSQKLGLKKQLFSMARVNRPGKMGNQSSKLKTKIKESKATLLQFLPRQHPLKSPFSLWSNLQNSVNNHQSSDLVLPQKLRQAPKIQQFHLGSQSNPLSSSQLFYLQKLRREHKLLS